MPSDLQLCRDLTGVEEVSERLVASIMKQVRDRFGATAVDALAQTCEEGSGGAMAIIAQAEAAKAIAFGIYMGRLPEAADEDTTGYAVPEDYFESVVWKVIQAHPLALSGGYFGHWHYAPEDTYG